MVSKALLLGTALTAAAVAAKMPSDILFLVAAAFSLAGAAFVPVLVLGVFWSRANAPGAIAGIVGGVGVTAYYLVSAHPPLRAALGLIGPPQLWWGIQPISAGLFGVPAGFAAVVLISWLTPQPALAQRQMLADLRTPPLR